MFISFLLLFMAPTTALAEMINSPQFIYRDWRIYNHYSYYKTSKNFDNESASVDLSDGNEFSYHHNTTSFQYGLFRRFNLLGGVRLSSVRSLTSGFERINSGLSDVILGGDILAIAGAFSLVPSFLVNIPIAKVDPDTDQALLSDGAFELIAKLYASYRWKMTTTYTSLGISTLGDGRGGRGYYHLGVKTKLGKVRLQFEVNGSGTYASDEFTDQSSSRTDVTDRVNGGSFAFYSINPSYTRVAAKFIYKFNNKILAGLGYSADVRGSRTSSGSMFLASLEFRPSGKTPASVRYETPERAKPPVRSHPPVRSKPKTRPSVRKRPPVQAPPPRKRKKRRKKSQDLNRDTFMEQIQELDKDYFKNDPIYPPQQKKEDTTYP